MSAEENHNKIELCVPFHCSTPTFSKFAVSCLVLNMFSDVEWTTLMCRSCQAWYLISDMIRIPLINKIQKHYFHTRFQYI